MSSKFKSINITFSDENHNPKVFFGIGKVFSPLYFITKPFERFLAKKWGWYLEAKLTK